jgi:hypothetical protein
VVQETTESSKARRGTTTVNGVYVRGSVNKSDAVFTIDTGASCSIVSVKLFKKLEQGCRPTLKETSVKISGAGGKKLCCLGSSIFDIEIGPLRIRMPMIVANITDDVLLGADVLMDGETGKADILLSQNKMLLQGKTIPLEQHYSPLHIREIHLADDCRIPARSEVITEVFIERKEEDENQEWILEPAPQLAEKYSIAMASTLVDTSCHTTARVRLMNPFEEDRILYQDTMIGFASQIDGITTCVDEIPGTSVEETENIRQIQIDSTETMTHQEITSDALEKLKSTLPAHLTELFAESVKERTHEEANVIAKLLGKYQETFSKDDLDLGLTHLTEHTINTGNAKPIKQRPRPVPMAFADEDKKAIEKLLEQGCIQPSTSPWAAPMVFVRKKNGQVRPCIDYRKLNQITCKDAFPLPKTRDCLDAVAGATLFSSLDITSAYNQIPVKSEDIKKTAFVTKYGLFEYTTMPFGLCNAPATFQRVMEIALAGLQWTTCLIYLDDVLIFGRNFQEQVTRIEAVLEKIKAAGLKLKPSKCHLLQKEVGFLGHVLSAKGIRPAPDNVEKILNWEPPKTVKEVQSFLGMANYYRRFIKDYSSIARPLINLTRKEQKFEWTEACQASFENLQKLLVTRPIMAHPQENTDFILDTDACDVSIGAVLSQVQNGEERVVAYGSKSLNKAERNYCVTDRELLAVRYFTEHYRSYLLGRKFLVRTDHQALKWIFTMKEPKNRIARWIEALSEYNFEIEHRQGIKHGNADAMSRCPNPWDCECKNFEALRCGPCKRCQRKNEQMEGTFPNLEVIDEQRQVGTEAAVRITRSSLRSHNLLTCMNIDVQKKQMTDDDIRPVYQWVKNGARPTPQELKNASPATRHYALIFNTLVIHQDVLCHKYCNHDLSTSHLRIVVPKGMRREILQQAHDGIMSGHLGEKKTRERVRRSFYWFDLRADVATYVQQCDTCMMIKGPTKKPKAPLGDMTTGAPWDRLSIDIMGPLPESSQGNKYILVVTDYFTKWVEIFAIPDQQAETCANILLNEVFARYGCPYDLHSDQGRNFTGEIFTELCKVLQIRKTRTTPYHPSGNGQVERFNRTLIRMIKAYLKGEQENWDRNLGCLAGAYRASVHESTGFTPNMLMFGRETRLPIELMFCPPEGNTSETYGGFAHHIRERLDRAHHLCRNQLQAKGQRQRESYDAKSTLRKFQLGDLVWFAAFTEDKNLAPKLRRKYTGPAVITNKLNDLVYQIQINKKDKRVVHHDKLLPYLGSNRPSWAKKTSHL